MYSCFFPTCTLLCLFLQVFKRIDKLEFLCFHIDLEYRELRKVFGGSKPVGPRSSTSAKDVC